MDARSAWLHGAASQGRNAMIYESERHAELVLEKLENPGGWTFADHHSQGESFILEAGTPVRFRITAPPLPGVSPSFYVVPSSSHGEQDGVPAAAGGLLGIHAATPLCTNPPLTTPAVGNGRVASAQGWPPMAGRTPQQAPSQEGAWLEMGFPTEAAARSVLGDDTVDLMVFSSCPLSPAPTTSCRP